MNKGSATKRTLLRLYRTMMMKILSTTLAFLMLFSSMGFSMATHYCGGRAVDTQLLIVDTEIGCGMELLAVCNKDQQALTSGCCSNDLFKIQIEDEFNVETAQLELDEAFLSVFLSSYIELIVSDEEAEFPDQAHSPPLLEQDVFILNQSFLL